MRRATTISQISRDKDGVNYKALCPCPFCNERQNSLVANSLDNRWECHACGKKGSVYQHRDRNVLILDTDEDVSRG